MIQMQGDTRDSQLLEAREHEFQEPGIGASRAVTDQLCANLSHFSEPSTLPASFAKDASAVPELQRKRLIFQWPGCDSGYRWCEIGAKSQEVIVPVQKAKRSLPDALVSTGVEVKELNRRWRQFLVPFSCQKRRKGRGDVSPLRSVIKEDVTKASGQTDRLFFHACTSKNQKALPGVPERALKLLRGSATHSSGHPGAQTHTHHDDGDDSWRMSE
jgi:hypothetical protein